MKRVVVYCVVILIIFLMSLDIIRSSEITGEVITGEITQSIGINVTVINMTVIVVPSITIHFPENKSYFMDHSFPVFFSRMNANTIWYALDNSPNITLPLNTHNFTLNLSQGGHLLRMYVNNSNNTIASDKISFAINASLFNFVISECNGSRKGRSTNFSMIPYDRLQNFTNLVFDNAEYGTIDFLSNSINLTKNAVNNSLDLDRYINLSFNRIELNSSALSELNISASLQMNNLTFTNPRLLKDGVVCSSSICTEKSYSGGTLRFNVTGFSVYTAEETPADEIETPLIKRGSESESGGLSNTGEFTLDKDKIKIKLKQGESTSETITIKNTQNKKIKITIETKTIEDFIRIIEKNIELNPLETKTISFDFIASDTALPDLYTGKIILKSGKIIQELAVSITLDSFSPLFDVDVTIPKEFLTINAGEKLVASIHLFETQAVGKVDVEVQYLIEDIYGNFIFLDKHTLTVEGETVFVKSFEIPLGSKMGDYILYVRIDYEGKTASASNSFAVGNNRFESLRKTVSFNKILIYSIIFLVFFIVILLLFLFVAFIKLRRELIKKGAFKNKLRNRIHTVTLKP